MDVGTLVGIGGALALIVASIGMSGSSIRGFIDPASAVCVIGGMAMATLVAYPLPRLRQLASVMKKLLFTTEFGAQATIKQLTEMCIVVRREGLLALDAAINNVEDPFLRKGAQFVVDGTDPELTRAVLHNDLTSKRKRHADARGMLEFMGSSAPAFGMIGTLIGLVAMLAKLDPATLGPKMAVALLTTFYGSILANVVFIPGARKLQEASDRELLVNTIMVEGLLGIQAGENPRQLEDKLRAFLPVGQRGPDTKPGAQAAEEAA